MHLQGGIRNIISVNVHVLGKLERRKIEIGRFG